MAESTPVSFRDLAERELQIQQRGRGPRRWLFVLMALLLVAGLAGWYLYPFLISDRSLVEQAEVRVEKRMEMPERPVLAPEREDQASAGELLPTEAEEPPDAVSVQEPQDVFDSSPAGSPSEITEIADVDGVAPVGSEPAPEEVAPVAGVEELLYRVLIGPIVNSEEVDHAMTVLRDKGFRPQLLASSGTVDMIRLLEGIYPPAQARERLEELLPEFPSAFLLPDGDRWALYIGSFSDRDRARRQQRALAERQIQVAQVDSQLTMTGTLVIVARTDETTAEGIATELRATGLRARVEAER